MTDYKNEYQKYADDAVRGRAQEEGFGRLRMSVFWAVAGLLGSFLSHMLGFEPPKYMAWAIVATAPLAVITYIVNFIRLPNEHKLSSLSLLIGFMTLLLAAGSIFLAKHFGITARM